MHDAAQEVQKAARKKLIVSGMKYVFQQGDQATMPTGNGGLVWSPPFGKNAIYKDAIAPYDLESNNKFDEKISAYRVKTPMPMYLQKLYDAIMAVPRDPDVIVEVDQASLDSLMNMLRGKEITIELNTVNENTTAILTGTVTFTMKTFIKDIGFEWDYSNKQYTMDIAEEGKLQEVSNELSDMCREWAITFIDNSA